MKLRTCAGALAVLVAIAGCTDPVIGDPAPSTTTTSSAETSPVPPVKRPLDASHFLDRPCDLLPERWVAKREFQPGKDVEPLTASSGPSCGWRSSGQLQIIIDTGNQKNGMGGVAGMYRAHRMGQIKFFELTEIDGYPAAYWGGTDRRTDGKVHLDVGIQDDLSIGVISTWTIVREDEAVPTAVAAAKQILKTLKAAQ